MRKTIAIFGSSRRYGNTGKFVDQIVNELDIEVVDLGLKNISAYDYEHKNMNDDFLPLIDHILKYENILFVSPVYWYSMSAQMKLFIDRTTDLLDIEHLKERGRALRGKTAFAVSSSVSEQIDESFIEPFTRTFAYLGMEYGGCIHANCVNGFDPAALQNDINRFVGKLDLSAV